MTNIFRWSWRFETNYVLLWKSLKDGSAIAYKTYKIGSIICTLESMKALCSLNTSMITNIKMKWFAGESWKLVRNIAVGYESYIHYYDLERRISICHSKLTHTEKSFAKTAIQDGATWFAANDLSRKDKSSRFTENLWEIKASNTTLKSFPADVLIWK